MKDTQQRNDFYYSRRQFEAYRDAGLGYRRLCKLDNGETAEYTEAVDLARLNDPEYASALLPHKDRWPDSVYLGEGEIVSAEKIDRNGNVTQATFTV